MGSKAQIAPDLVSGNHSAGSVSFDTFPSPPEHFLQDGPGSPRTPHLTLVSHFSKDPCTF